MPTSEIDPFSLDASSDLDRIFGKGEALPSGPTTPIEADPFEVLPLGPGPERPKAHALSPRERREASRQASPGSPPLKGLAKRTLPVVSGYRNDYLSVSRLKTFENCPRQFRLKYIDRVHPAKENDLAEHYNEPSTFGSLLHLVLERTYRHFVEQGLAGRVDDVTISRFYRDSFEEFPDLSGADLFAEGIELIRAYFRRYPVLDSKEVLAVEQKFEFPLGVFTVMGFIDRIDKLDHETIRIVDYKSNRMLFSHEETETDIQLSTYGLACRDLYPWAKKIEYRFEMLRHDTLLSTERSDQALKDAADYLVVLGRRTEEAHDYPARLNTLCGWCDVRSFCGEYQDAMKEGHAITDEIPIDFEELSKERARVDALAKLFKDRKDTIDREMKARIKAADAEELSGAGWKYKLVSRMSTTYPTVKTIDILSEELGPRGVTRQQIEDGISKIEKGGIEQFLGQHVPLAVERKLIQVKLDLAASKRRGAAYLDARKV
jgi:RecB family exonuclease